MTINITNAKLFCNTHHCVFRIKYEKCFDRFSCVFRKVYEDLQENDDSRFRIVIEREVEIATYTHEDYDRAVGGALALAVNEIEHHRRAA